MMEYHLILSPRADAEMDAIFRYIAEDSPDNAAAMIDRLVAAMDSLELFPHRTIAEAQSHDLEYLVRSLPVSPYVIYFRVVEEEKVVRILHIRHGARQRPRRPDFE